MEYTNEIAKPSTRKKDVNDTSESEKRLSLKECHTPNVFPASFSRFEELEKLSNAITLLAGFLSFILFIKLLLFAPFLELKIIAFSGLLISGWLIKKSIASFNSSPKESKK